MRGGRGRARRPPYDGGRDARNRTAASRTAVLGRRARYSGMRASAARGFKVTYVTEIRAGKSEQTRALIVETALRLFRERGYEATTMRIIAKEAGVSVGNAYYYFSSKEQLVQAYYDRAQTEHEAACRDLLSSERKFAARLSGVLRAWVQ